jgi:hypothetical protein
MIYLLFGLLFILLVVGVNIDSIRVNDLFDTNARKVYDDLSILIDSQESSISKIKEASKNANYNFTNPYVLVNPFSLNPCSAIMVFTTEEPSKVNVEINDKNVGTTDVGALHIIPVYGLYENNYNHVVLTLDDGSRHEETIQTEDIYSHLQIEKTDRDTNSTYLSYLESGDMTSIYGYNYYNDINLVISGLNYISSFKVNGEGLTLEYNAKKGLNPILIDIDFLGKIKKVYKKNNSYISENNISINLYKDGINDYLLKKATNDETLSEYNILDLDSTINSLSKAHLYFKEFNITVNNSYLTYDIDETGYLILVRNDGVILSYYIDDAKNIKIDSNYEYSLFLNTDNTYYNLYTIIKK